MASAGKSSGATPIGRRGAKTGSNNVAVRTNPAQLEPRASAEIPSMPDHPSMPDQPGMAVANVEPRAVLKPGPSAPATATTTATALRAQLEAFKTIERFSRYHYNVAGDYLEWGVALARAFIAPGTPAEHVASQATLATQFGEKLQGRAREFVSLTSETRATLNELVGNATARFAETIKRLA